MLERVSLKEASALLCCAPATIKKRMKDAGLTTSLRAGTKVAIPKEKLYRLYFVENKSFNDIIGETGCTSYHIQSSFKKYRWTPRDRGTGNIVKSRPFSDQTIIKMYKQFESTVAAASELGMSCQGINHILRKHNIKRTGNLKAQKNGGERVVVGWLKEWGVGPILERWDAWDKPMPSKWNHVDIYVPEHKIFIEFNGVNYHKNILERDQRKRKEFLAAYPDHQWLVVTDAQISNKSTKTVVKENLRHKFLEGPLGVRDLQFYECDDHRYALYFLDKFHTRKRSSFHTRVFTIQLNGVIVGAATFGPTQHKDSGFDMEFKRLAICDQLPPNTASWFIQRCVDRFSSGTKLVTYIDSEHQGSAFKGCNWVLVGATKKCNSYHFAGPDNKVLGRRAAYLSAKKAGKPRSVWAIESGFKRVNDPEKKIFSYTVR